MLAAADPAPQLVQLTDAEAVGVHHDHHRGVGHVDADLDDGGAHQDVDLARAERRHHGVLLVGGQPTVHQPEPQTGQRPVAAGARTARPPWWAARRSGRPCAASSLSSMRDATT